MPMLFFNEKQYDNIMIIAFQKDYTFRNRWLLVLLLLLVLVIGLGYWKRSIYLMENVITYSEIK